MKSIFIPLIEDVAVGLNLFCSGQYILYLTDLKSKIKALYDIF